LFYALSQATRAICAVHLANNFLLTGHGLRWSPPQGEPDLMRRIVRPERRPTGSFSRLCDALGCDQLTEPTQLGALWRALPDLMVPNLPSLEPEWEAALHVRPVNVEERSVSGAAAIEMVVGPVPSSMSANEVERLVRRFPSLSGFEPVCDESGAPRLVGRGSQLYGLVLTRPYSVPLSSVALEAAVRAAAGGGYEGEAELFLVPTLPSGDELAPLALWWSVLFALSNVARYEPDTWFKALDIDRSLVAVALEECLAEALAVLPHLVLEALVGHRVEAHTYT
jgi:hypothetical protein